MGKKETSVKPKTKKQKKSVVQFTEATLKALTIFARIGKRSVSESFVCIFKDKIKVVHETGAIIAVFKFDEIELDKSFAIFDTSKFNKILTQFKSMKKDYELEFKDESTMIVKSGRNRFKLYLVDFQEKTSIEAEDLEDDRIKGYITVADEKIQEIKELIKEEKKAEFILLESDIEKIRKYQRIMNTSAGFVIKKSDTDGIKFVITDDIGGDSADTASFDLNEESIEFNELTETDKIMMHFPLDYLLEDDYKFTIGEKVLLQGQNSGIEYIIAPEIDSGFESEDYDDEEDEFEDDFS